MWCYNRIFKIQHIYRAPIICQDVHQTFSYVSSALDIVF